ncbi:DUF805 domain-containing protein [Hyphomonas sp.]|jgi:uncharacterized membrane protein YhaH (DUF805 family)|uniref:DUF805 domain-containing protein n=1 Tax=Hyphomonas sp. TaxID=87 RepID=UPI0025B7E87A|nr:DUF805 domain-containing protein [Hyphomonas sp.]
MVSFPDAVKMFFTRYVDFQGRSRRSEYWWVVLFNLIVSLVLVGLAFALGGNFESGELSPIAMILFAVFGLYMLAIILPSIALFVRRLHDINQTGWIYLGLVVASLIPFIGFIASIAMIVIACIPGTVGPNKYGPDPKGGVAADTFA